MFKLTALFHLGHVSQIKTSEHATLDDATGAAEGAAEWQVHNDSGKKVASSDCVQPMVADVDKVTMPATDNTASLAH